jgi:hypothetical protein
VLIVVGGTVVPTDFVSVLRVIIVIVIVLRVVVVVYVDARGGEGGASSAYDTIRRRSGHREGVR